MTQQAQAQTSNADLLAQLAKLQAENAALKASKQRALTLKIGKAGGMSVYGLGRYPTTLYKEQWLKLLAMKEEMEAFLNDPKNEFQMKQ